MREFPIVIRSLRKEPFISMNDVLAWFNVIRPDRAVDFTRIVNRPIYFEVKL